MDKDNSQKKKWFIEILERIGIWSLAESIWVWIMPSPYFLPASSEISSKIDKNWQWIHIPISIKHRWPRRYIPRCKAVACFVGGEHAGKEYPLRWRSDLPNGSSESVLIYGDKSYIPLVLRRDNRPSATLTDSTFFRGEGTLVYSDEDTDEYDEHKTIIIDKLDKNETTEFHTLMPGDHDLKIKIISGHLKWESPHIYKIHIPDESTSNSHFFCNLTDSPQ